MIAPEGWPFILFPAFAGVVLTIFGEPYFGWGLVAVGLLALLLFRDPIRTCGGPPRIVCAPVDGRVMLIEDTAESPDLRRLGILVSWRDVHVVRAPQSGVLDRLDRRPHGIRGAWSTAAGGFALSLDATRPLRPVLDRRLGEEMTRGERLGLLPLGGRVELRLPASAQLLVAVGDRVRAGHSAVATIEETEVS